MSTDAERPGDPLRLRGKTVRRKPQTLSPLDLAECEVAKLKNNDTQLKARVAELEGRLKTAGEDYWRQCYNTESSAHYALQRRVGRIEDGKRWAALIWVAVGAAVGIMLTIYAVAVRPAPPVPSAVTIQSPIPVVVSGEHCWQVDGKRLCADHITTSAPDISNQTIQVTGYDKPGAVLWSITGVRALVAAP